MRTHLLLLALGLSILPLAPFGGPGLAEASLGMNLSGPADYMTELPFVDAFRTSRPWISQREGAAWGQGPPLSLDKHGWVTRLEPGCYAETLLLTIDDGHYPSGRYTVLYEGQGQLSFGGAATIFREDPGRILIDVDATKGAIFLRLLKTDPEDYLRNIRVILPGFEETWQSDPFRPQFLERWRGIRCFRFMDWMHTNGSTVASWEDRPTLETATWSEKGVALETMIDLCNRQRAAPWFCMPHLCDDNYVRQFATQVRDQLDEDLRVYIEYSNEVWNGIFPQAQHAQHRGQELGLGDPDRPWEGGGMFYARRSVEIFRIWEDVFGGTDRLVRVLAWQAANPWWSENIILPFEDCYKEADALAIAPYISLLVPAEGDGLTADKVARWSLDELFAHVEEMCLPECISWMREQKRIADQFGLDLIAYEGGQHLVGVGGGENNDALTALFLRANADPRMGEVYRRYLEAWTDAGGGLFCHFSSLSAWSKWGSWGLLQYEDEDPSTSPKFRAVMDWGRSVNP